jgi:hypothetical protein
MHKRTSGQERRASASRGVPETHLQHGYRTRSGTLVSRGNKSGGRQPAVGLQTASAMAMRRIAVIGFAFREHTTGGLRPPLLCRGANVRRRKNDFCDAQTHAEKERRASARRGCGKHACADTSALVRRTADGVYADRRCIGVNSFHGGLTPPVLAQRKQVPGAGGHQSAARFVSHGGLTPPALVSWRERLPVRKRFLRCTNVHSPGAANGRQPDDNVCRQRSRQVRN